MYSTDGVTWQPVADVNAGNWQTARYPIPIYSWQELQHLQVALVGLNATDSPKVYLDALGVEVDYADAPNGTIDPNTAQTAATSTVFAQSSSSASVSSSAPADALQSVFDPSAQQKCSVTPFSNAAYPGGSASYVLSMVVQAPPEVLPSSSAASSGRAYPPPAPPPPPAPITAPLYETALGSLPAGVTGTIVPGGPPGIDTIGLTVAPSTVPGSYGVIVIYKERQADGKILPNFCQFNLVVK